MAQCAFHVQDGIRNGGAALFGTTHVAAAGAAWVIKFTARTVVDWANSEALLPRMRRVFRFLSGARRAAVGADMVRNLGRRPELQYGSWDWRDVRWGVVSTMGRSCVASLATLWGPRRQVL